MAAAKNRQKSSVVHRTLLDANVSVEPMQQLVARRDLPSQTWCRVCRADLCEIRRERRALDVEGNRYNRFRRRHWCGLEHRPPVTQGESPRQRRKKNQGTTHTSFQRSALWGPISILAEKLNALAWGLHAKKTLLVTTRCPKRLENAVKSRARRDRPPGVIAFYRRAMAAAVFLKRWG